MISLMLTLSTKISPIRLKEVRSHFSLPFQSYNAAAIPSAVDPQTGQRRTVEPQSQTLIT